MKSVRLIKPHTHAGKKLAPNSTLLIKDETADWLVSQGVAVFVNPNDQPASPRSFPVRPMTGPSIFSCCGRK